MTQNETSSDRRQFLSTAVRTVAFGAIGAYTIGQHVKRERLANDPNCVKIHTCAQCIEFGGCELPKAESARHEFPQKV